MRWITGSILYLPSGTFPFRLVFLIIAHRKPFSQMVPRTWVSWICKYKSITRTRRLAMRTTASVLPVYRFGRGYSWQRYWAWSWYGRSSWSWISARWIDSTILREKLSRSPARSKIIIIIVETYNAIVLSIRAKPITERVNCSRRRLSSWMFNSWFERHTFSQKPREYWVIIIILVSYNELSLDV